MAEPRPNGEAPATPETSTEPPAKSLREIAEESWDEVVEDTASPDEGDDGSQQPVDEGGVKRDARGRFAPKDEGEEPGVAADASQPSPETDSAPQPEAATQPQPGEAAAAPANWSADDRANFEKLAPEGKAFLLRRHSEMESDYQRRVQATGVAAQFTEAVAPIFSDPTIQGSLQQNGLSPVEAIQQWAGMHRRAYHPDPRERVNLLVEIATNIGLNPAAIFATSQPSLPPGLSEQDMRDPAIKYFAETIGRQSNEVQQLRNSFQQMVNAQQQQQAEQTLKVHRWGIDSFAESKDERGNLLHPDFDAVLPQIVELYRANPQRDLKEAYETAVWMNPQVREARAQAERARAQQQQANQRAAQAAKTNLRGRTNAVTGMANGQDGPKTLRDTIEQAADEIGF